jgi:uncharacterized protein (DUF697 family)
MAKKTVTKKATTKKAPTKKATTKKTVTKKTVQVTRTRRRPYEFPAEQPAAEAGASGPSGAIAASTESGDAVAAQPPVARAAVTPTVDASTNDQPAAQERSADTTQAPVASNQQSADARVERISDSAPSQERARDSVAPVADGKQVAEKPTQPSTEFKTSAAASKPKAKRQPTTDAEPALPSRVNDIIKTHVIMAMGIGTIPAPVFDAVAIAVLQTRMVRQIAEAYDVPFERIPAWTVTSITGVLTVPGGLVSSMTKSIPVIGPWLGGTTATLVAGASTYAIGRVFAQHFGGGGTFLTLDPVKAKQAYSAGLDKGKGKAADIAAQAAGRFGFGAKPTA